jgi:hypothetical protein
MNTGRGLAIFIPRDYKSSFLCKFDIGLNVYYKWNVMRIVSVTYKKPANLLIAALQKHCKTLLSAREQNGVQNLQDVEAKLWQYATELQSVYPRCSLDKLDVISHQNIAQQFYNLLYNDEKPMITIFARPDDIEAAFRDYDQARHATSL